MFDAQEWLQSVSEAARIIAMQAAYQEAVRSRAAISPQSYGTHVSSSSSDRYGAIDTMLSRENSTEDAHKEIDNARQVFEGMARVGALEAEAATVLMLVHINLETKKGAADILHTSLATAKRRYNYGVDWLNAHGLAYAKAGKGRAE